MGIHSLSDMREGSIDSPWISVNEQTSTHYHAFIQSWHDQSPCSYVINAFNVTIIVTIAIIRIRLRKHILRMIWMRRNYWSWLQICKYVKFANMSNSAPACQQLNRRTGLRSDCMLTAPLRESGRDIVSLSVSPFFPFPSHFGIGNSLLFFRWKAHLQHSCCQNHNFCSPVVIVLVSITLALMERWRTHLSC